MYMVECAGQVSVQNEACLKPSWGSRNAVDEVPLIFEPRKQPVARDQVRTRPECEIILPWAVDRATELRCSPSPVERPASPDYTHPKLLPDTEQAQESPSNNDEEGVPVDALNSVIAHLVAEAQREEAPLVLKRSQHLRQLPSYLREFVCDCLQSSKIKPGGSAHGELLWMAWELCNQERKYSLCKLEIVGRINPPMTRRPHYLQQPNCSACLLFNSRSLLTANITITFNYSGTNVNAGIGSKLFSIPTSIEIDLMSAQSDSVN